MTERYDKFQVAPLYLLAVAVPVSISVGTIATVLVLLGAGTVAALRRRETVWPHRGVILALAALIVFYFLATLLAAPYPHNWHKFAEELWIKLLLLGVPVLAAGRHRHLENAVKLTLLLGVIAAAYAIVQHFLGVDPIRDRSIYRPQFGHHAVSGFFSHHLSYAGQVLILLIMGTAWFLEGKAGSRRPWLLPVLAVLALALMWSFARSAMIGVAAGLLVLVALQKGRTRWYALAGIAVALGAILAVSPVRRHFLALFELDRHLTRLNLWHSSWDGLNANPLLGLGPGNFPALLQGYQVPGHYETLGHAHNDLLMHGVNAGWPGLVAAVALLVVTCVLFWRARQEAGTGRWILGGAVGVQLAITVAGFFQVYQTDDEVEMLLYFVLGCAAALSRAEPESPGRSGI